MIILLDQNDLAPWIDPELPTLHGLKYTLMTSTTYANAVFYRSPKMVVTVLKNRNPLKTWKITWPESEDLFPPDKMVGDDMMQLLMETPKREGLV